MEKDEIIELFKNFLDETGHYHGFVAWLKTQGYEPGELGFIEE